MNDWLNKLKRWISIFITVTRPERLLVLGYGLIISIGFALLISSWAQKKPTAELDVFFTVVSAVSTTGLTTISIIDHYTFWGQLVTLVLFQIGGLGYMTVASFLYFNIKKSILNTNEELVEKDFDLPEGIQVGKFIRRVVVFSLVIEILGAVFLYLVFRKNPSISSPVWYGIYHSISGFCTTGFTLFSESFNAFAGNFWFNVIIMTLSICGSIGFVVIFDIVDTLFRSKRKLSFTTKIILRMTVYIIPIAFLLILIIESANIKIDTIQGFLTSMFLVMTSATTVGFNTIDTDAVSSSTRVVIIILMVIGASPAGTGGGLKITNLGTLMAVVKSRLSGHIKIQFLGHRISPERISFASTSLIVYLALLSIGMLLLTLLENIPPEKIFFEMVSALSTVGLSLGITASLSALGKVVVAGAMIAGRIGVMTFTLAFNQNRMLKEKTQENEEKRQNKEEEDKEAEEARKVVRRESEVREKKYKEELSEKEEKIEELKEEIEKNKSEEEKKKKSD